MAKLFLLVSPFLNLLILLQIAKYAESQQKHINSFIVARNLTTANTNNNNVYSTGGCRKPSLEITGPFQSSVSHFQKLAICRSLKPIKPSRVLDMSKSLCSNGWTICNHLEKGVVGLSWNNNKNKGPNGCFGFKFGDHKKATGYGSKCHTNLYFDGILCCPIEKHLKKTKNISSKSKSKRSFKKHYLLTNEIH